MAGIRRSVFTPLLLKSSGLSTGSTFKREANPPKAPLPGGVAGAGKLVVPDPARGPQTGYLAPNSSPSFLRERPYRVFEHVRLSHLLSPMPAIGNGRFCGRTPHGNESAGPSKPADRHGGCRRREREPRSGDIEIQTRVDQGRVEALRLGLGL